MLLSHTKKLCNFLLPLGWNALYHVIAGGHSWDFLDFTEHQKHTSHQPLHLECH